MKKFHFKVRKISHRLTIVYALLFLVALVSANVATFASIRYYIDQTSSNQLNMINQAIQNESNTIEDVKNIDFKNLSQITENIGISLIYENSIIYNTVEYSNVPQINKSNINMIESFGKGENTLLYLNTEHVLKDNSILYIQVVKNMDNEQEYLVVLFGVMIKVDIFILGFSVLCGYIISKKALNPIGKIMNQAKNISASNLKERIVIDGPDDELKRLAGTFNDLISRVQYSYDKQNQFTLDASHELATPMAVIKGYIDLIDRWGKNNPQVLDEGIQAMKRELKDMTTLLDTLFFISKSDNEVLKLKRTKFSLNELVDEIIRESKLVDDSHIIFSNLNEKTPIEADKNRIKQMIRAIVDNSIKYTQSGGIIEINLMKKEKNAVIIVLDNGIGIPEEQLSHIFDRFFRVDKARSRELGGTGLGLSIVKKIVEIHGGTIKVESKIGNGTKMTVSIPFEFNVDP